MISGHATLSDRLPRTQVDWNIRKLQPELHSAQEKLHIEVRDVGPPHQQQGARQQKLADKSTSVVHHAPFSTEEASAGSDTLRIQSVHSIITNPRLSMTMK